MDDLENLQNLLKSADITNRKLASQLVEGTIGFSNLKDDLAALFISQLVIPLLRTKEQADRAEAFTLLDKLSLKVIKQAISINHRGPAPFSFSDIILLDPRHLAWAINKGLLYLFEEQTQNVYWQSRRLKILPSEIGQIKNLERISLSSNELTELPESLSNCVQLSKLSLEDNQLSKLPESYQKLKKLTWLNLFKNNFSILPDWLGELTELETLFVGYNQLTELPQAIGQCQKLTGLNAADNQLQKLPECIGNLRQLNLLDLASNQLDYLPESFKRLQKIRTLDLSFNNFREIPEVLFFLPDLDRLDMQGNPSLSFDLAQLSRFPKLQQLRLPSPPSDDGVEHPSQLKLANRKLTIDFVN